jgi:hypothetical protein
VTTVPADRALPPREPLLEAVTEALEPSLYPEKLAHDETSDYTDQRHEGIAVLQILVNDSGQLLTG